MDSSGEVLDIDADPVFFKLQLNDLKNLGFQHVTLPELKPEAWPDAESTSLRGKDFCFRLKRSK